MPFIEQSIQDLIDWVENGVEPAETETVLTGCPGVARAAVIAQDGPGGMRLVTFHLRRTKE